MSEALDYLDRLIANTRDYSNLPSTPSGVKIIEEYNLLTLKHLRKLIVEESDRLHDFAITPEKIMGLSRRSFPYQFKENDMININPLDLVDCYKKE